MPWVDQVPAIVEAWLPGQEGALAVADVLFGKINPSGKLPVSFPKRIEDSPSYLFFPGFRDANYGESIFMGYRYYDKKQVEPLFAFGHGLSYTQFAYSNLRLPETNRIGQGMTVSVDIKNVGAHAGAEVAQLYVADQQCREMCPVRELKGFARVELQPGETRTVTLSLDARAFAHYDAYSEAWLTTPGKYAVSLGSSSRDLRLNGELQLVTQ
jgi:beta-glucosidase